MLPLWTLKCFLGSRLLFPVTLQSSPKCTARGEAPVCSPEVTLKASHSAGKTASPRGSGQIPRAGFPHGGCSARKSQLSPVGPAV